MLKIDAIKQLRWLLGALLLITAVGMLFYQANGKLHRIPQEKKVEFRLDETLEDIPDVFLCHGEYESIFQGKSGSVFFFLAEKPVPKLIRFQSDIDRWDTLCELEEP